MTGHYDAQVRRQLDETRERLKVVEAERDALREQLEARCLVVPPVSPFEHAKPIGPCLVTGPHVEHRDVSGVRWRPLSDEERARHEAWVAMVQLGEEMRGEPDAA